MTETKKRAGRKPGGKVRTQEFDDIVIRHIPEDRNPIQHKDLMSICVKSGIMAYQSMQDALERLQLKGLIDKEELQAIEGKRKAGTYYRRTSPSLMLTFIEELPININEGLPLLEKAGFNPTEEELKKFWADYHIALSGIFTDLIIYASTPDKDQAKKRLNLVLTDIIAPELIKSTEILKKIK